jgi:redox-sensitive bicupin YhaK (pirin superfamily)
MRFIQMWLIPSRRGLEPSVEQASFPESERRKRWLPVLVPAPGYGRQDQPMNSAAVTVHQDAAVYATLLAAGESLTHRFRDGFDGYLFVVHGEISITTPQGGSVLDEGAAAKVMREPELAVRAGSAGAEALLVETRRS